VQVISGIGQAIDADVKARGQAVGEQASLALVHIKRPAAPGARGSEHQVQRLSRIHRAQELAAAQAGVSAVGEPGGVIRERELFHRSCK
jgi:hypothetical protein